MQRQVLVIQRVQRTVDVPLVQYIDRIVDVPVVKLRQALPIQTVQKTLQRLHRAVHVPVETSRERVQQRTVEFEHQSHLALTFSQKDFERETDEVSEKSAAVPQANADSDGAKRGLSPTREHFDKLKPDSTESPAGEGTSRTTDLASTR